jgi:hypothetical protein
VAPSLGVGKFQALALSSGLSMGEEAGFRRIVRASTASVTIARLANMDGGWVLAASLATLGAFAYFSKSLVS